MVRCPDCETPNSVDSKFCKFCGAPLPEEERVDAQMKLNELIAEGYKLFNEGRTDEAALTAESALTSSPNDTQALSLKGMCFERTGDLAAALELYERVVELNPDSSLDKIKVAHVRNLLAAKVAEEPKPNRRVAMIGAAAAIVLVMTGGAILASMLSGSGTKTAVNLPTPGDSPQIAGFDPSQTSYLQPQPDQTQKGGVQPQPDQAAPKIPSDGSAFPSRQPGQLPWLPNGLADDTKVERVPDANTPSPTPVPTGGGGSTTTIDPQPTIPPAQEPPKEDPMKGIDIKVYRNEGATNGGTSSVDGPNQLKALLKTGSEQFLVRNYSAAAKTYERAIRAGGDPATLNQRVGQCYANLGRKSEAINAYTKAVDAYQNAISQRGESQTLRAGLDSCKAALKVLRS